MDDKMMKEAMEMMKNQFFSRYADTDSYCDIKNIEYDLQRFVYRSKENSDCTANVKVDKNGSSSTIKVVRKYQTNENFKIQHIFCFASYSQSRDINQLSKHIKKNFGMISGMILKILKS